MKILKILIPVLLFAAAAFGVWWYLTDILPEKQAEDTGSGTPAPGETDVPETEVGGIVEITVEGEEYSFSPATITVKRGDSVALTFKNVGSNIHTWTINELDLNTGSVFPGSSRTLEFDAAEAGTYEIYCAIAGHKEFGMVGTLKVE